MLLCLARASDLRIRDLALILGVTERSAQKIVSDLVEAGYVTRTRVGRRNAYQIHVERPLPMSRELSVSHMFELFDPEGLVPAPDDPEGLLPRPDGPDGPLPRPDGPDDTAPEG